MNIEEALRKMKLKKFGYFSKFLNLFQKVYDKNIEKIKKEKNLFFPGK